MRGNFDLQGVIDIHGHCGPSLFDRRVDGCEFAREAAEAGMAAVVLKEHFLPTIYGVPFINRLLGTEDFEIEVFGGLVMNYCNGGFNPFAVQTAIEFGAAFVWAPTIDAKNQVAVTGTPGQHTHHQHQSHEHEEYRNITGLTPVNGSGKLKADVHRCVEKIVDHEIGLGIGHLSYEETQAMVEYAAGLGHRKVVIDHPSYPTEFDHDQLEALVDLGAYINYPFTSISPAYGWRSIDEVYQDVRALGVENCLISSGVGQIPNPSSPEAMRIFGEALLEKGLSAAEVDLLAKENPARFIVD